MTEEEVKELDRYSLLKQQSLPFDFLIEEENQRQEEERKKKLAKEAARVARLEAITKLHYPKPDGEDTRSDNQYLMEQQYQYVIKHDPKALNRMYLRSISVGLRFIGAIGKTNKHIRRMQREDRKIKAMDAASYIPEQFITRPEFFIDKNFPGYLFLRILHECFYQTEAEKIVDYVDLSLFFKEGTNDEPTKDDMINRSIFYTREQWNELQRKRRAEQRAKELQDMIAWLEAKKKEKQK